MQGEVECQHKRFGTCVLDFYATTGKCCLSNKSNFGIDLA